MSSIKFTTVSSVREHLVTVLSSLEVLVHVKKTPW